MMKEQSFGASSNPATDWKAIDWPTIQRCVRRLQLRIAKAIRAAQHGKAKALSLLLNQSRSAASALTPEGATINGELYGSGTTAVVFSVMGNCDPGWREFACLTAAQGFMALTYQWRDCGPSGPTDEAALFQNFVNDARGAINFVRVQGAEEIILAGASLGGLASAKLAIESQASGIIVFASPLEIPRWDFRIETADLNTDIPKLFLTAEEDYVVPLENSRALYELATEPKEWQTYPGNEHGTELFETDIGEEVQLRILGFILEVASRN